MYSCHLFLISSASVRSILFLSFIVPIFVRNSPLVSPLVSNFLEEISSFSHCIVFLYFFALITKKAFLFLLATLWNSAFSWEYLSPSPLLLASLLFSAICKASPDNHFAFLHFFSLGMVLVTAAYTVYIMTSLVAQTVKNLPAMQETQV